MGYKATDTCLQKAAEDEPIFVLRAKDKLAPSIVRRWADLAEAASHPDSPTRDKVREARLFAKTMEGWQQKNGSKIPD